MYRPEGCKNPYLYFGSPHTEFDIISNGRHKAFEAGADAMLEGLKKEGIPVELNGKSTIPASGRFPEIIIEDGVFGRGTVVFIPEEEYVTD